jgi:hypothetical protein
VRTVQIHLVYQGGCVRRSACHPLPKHLCRHSAIHIMVLHTYPNPSTLNAGPMCDSVNTKFTLLPSSSDFVLLLKIASWFNCAQYPNTGPPSTHSLMSVSNGPAMISFSEQSNNTSLNEDFVQGTREVTIQGRL